MIGHANMWLCSLFYQFYYLDTYKVDYSIKEIFLKYPLYLGCCVNVPLIFQNVSTDTLNIEKIQLPPYTSSTPPLLKLLCQYVSYTSKMSQSTP